MKPIIIDMKDMSDSTEVYESKPNRFLVYTIYVILLIFIIAFLWMAFSKIELVVKGNGMFRGEEPLYEISSSIGGAVQSCNAKDGQLVEEGNLLFTVESETLAESMKSYSEELAKVNQRLEILKAYEKSLDVSQGLPDTLATNPYYQEFANRRELLYGNVQANSENTQGQKNIYSGSIDNTSTTLQQYETKKAKLEQTKSCIASRKNTFGNEDNYYASIVNSYLATYNLTASQYDTSIQEYENQKTQYDKTLKSASTTSQNTVDKSEIKKERKAVKEKIASLKTEREQALSNLEYQQISTIEQMIESTDETIQSLKSSITSSELQLDSITTQNPSTQKDLQILEEKGNIAAEILSYESKAREYENYLKNYDIQNNNCKITANASGYFYYEQDIQQGSYIQEGSTIGKIYPSQNEGFYAEVYIENADIAKLDKGQQVKLEIPAYPSSEYGYFTGEIESISKDITVDQNTGSAYYVIKVLCQNTQIANKQGETGNLRNGMACQAKIIVGEEKVLKYLLRKIDLLD